MNGAPIEQRLRELLQDIERGTIHESTANAAPSQDAVPTRHIEICHSLGRSVLESRKPYDPCRAGVSRVRNALYGAHCKLICPNCGYREVCSDLF